MSTGSEAGFVLNPADLHIWTDEFLEKRLAWKVDRPLTILEVRFLLACFIFFLNKRPCGHSPRRKSEPL
jgi:hypothetical protein